MKYYNKNNITDKHSALWLRLGKLALVKSPADFIWTTLADTSVMCQEIKLSRKTPEKGKYLPADSRTSALDSL